MVAALAVSGLFWSASTVRAQDSSGANIGSTPVMQILKLEQANVGDATIIAYIQNSGTSYNLPADQIIYLRQQGVSDPVLTAMLNQPKSGAVVATAPAALAPVATSTTPAPEPVASTITTAAGTTITTASGSTATVAPTVTYVQTVPVTTYYAQPYYYPAYAYPPVSLSFGWVWGCGGGWHGGWHH